MIIKRLLTLTFLLGSFWLTAQKIPFQGKLTENDEPVTGTKTFTFGFTSSGWTETHEGVSILDGYYSVILGSITPIPDTLFDLTDAVELTINVDNTDLSPVMIYAPIGSKTGRFVITETTDTSTVALNAINNSTGTSFGTGSRIGAYIEARGEGLNSGLIIDTENGRALQNYSEITDPTVYGLAQLGAITGSTDVGGRVIQGQYTAQGAGHGIAMSGYAGGSGMNWALWGRANSVQSDSMQIGAYVEAYGPGSHEHIGVRGIASGTNSSRNIGVHGLAYNGPNENWAGWFDGDVNVNGNFLVNGQQVDGNIDTIYNPLTVFFNTDTEEPTAVRAYSDGPGNGGVSYNTAMRGESYNNSYANVGLSGWATGSQGVDNSGGSFFSQVNNGSDTIVNTGVYMQANSPARNYGLRAIAFDGTENYGGEFTANGPGMNVGMYSTAFNGTDNWAGWFDGDVQVNGDFVLNGNSLGGNIQNFDSLTTKDIQLLSPDGNLKAHLNYFEANNAGSLVLYGNSDTTRTAILGSSGLTGGNSGLLYLYDQFDAAKARLRVDTLAGGADDYGILTLWNGDFTQSVYLDGSTGSGYFSGDVEVGGQLLVNGAPANDSIVSKDVQLLNESGSLKAHLNIFSTDAGSLVLNGANDSTKVILGSVGSGYGGYLGLYDSLRNIGAQLRTTNKGRGNLYTYNENHVNVGWFGGIGNDGFMQLVSYDDTETFTGALLAGSFADGALPELYIEGSKQLNYGLGRFRITQLSDNPDEETAMLEINKSNGGGYARLSVNQNTGGSDATGSAGYLELWGTSTPNISLGSRDWENHNLPNFNLYGTKTDGGTWFNTASNYGVAATSDSTHEFGFLDLFDVQDGIQIHTVALMANLNETGAGGLEIRDASGTTRVSLDGSGGNISANRTDGGSAANFFVASDNGGISIQNAASQSKFFYEAGSNIFILRNDTADSFVADATAGSISILGDLTANAVNQTSDKRYKKDIATLTGALDKTRELRGTSYFWKDSNKGDGRQIGVIAQEVEEVYPEFVHTDANGYKSVNYAQMVAVLIEAVKELDDKVSTLEKENGELKAELASKDSDELESLKSEVELIKKMLSLKVENEAESVGQNK